MKLASLRNGRDGRLVVVDADLRYYAPAGGIAATLQDALDDWGRAAPRLRDLAAALEAHQAKEALPFDATACAAPLPRAYHWVDGSAYVNHVELVRKARGAEMPASFWTDPLVYQGGSDDFLGPTEDAPFPSEDLGIDLEAEVAVVVGDVPMGSTPEAVRGRGDIRLVMLANDWSLRHLIPPELAKGFGFYQSKPATAFSPVAVTPDELGADWDGGRLHRPVAVHLNGQPFGAPEAGVDMTFDFAQLVAHCARTRNLRAGTIVGSGTISNYDRSRGSACIAERRMLEQLESGAPRTPFLKFGDQVRIEVLDRQGRTVFGAIEQRVIRPWR
ncbi:MAG: fumarylacetoacetate hydrolase family protein [Proteobacteria bacterium]|nr:fumarylacetoacetate hydrolase family protein [Pseudomonadota bacterium]